MKRGGYGCVFMGALLLLCVFIWGLFAFGVYYLGTLAIEVLAPDAGAAVVETLPKSSAAAEDAAEKQQAEVVAIEPPAELPRPTIGELDAEAEENRLIEAALLARAHKIEHCKITYYCCERYRHICGTGDGITALGGEVLAGVSCAVPAAIPLGSTILIDWGDGSPLEYRRADDRGGGVIGDHIDLAVPTHKEALQLGVARATVYWCEE